MNYQEFLKKKIKTNNPSGFEIEDEKLNPSLYDFQKFIVKRALKAGKFALFSDTGTGKTIMQLEWANQVRLHTGKPVLILAPLAVSGQTIKEGERFGIEVGKYKLQREKHDVFDYIQPIHISNYEQLHNIDVSPYGCVVLDESSILKNFTGKYKNLIIDTFKKTPYKLACTATPSPNDLNEIGNHSEFLDVMEAPDMRSRWFIRDEGMNNYRLKNHAKKDFYAWISSWAIMMINPSDLGFDGHAFDLKKLNYFEHKIDVVKQDNGKLFNDAHVNATNFNSELRRTMKERAEKAAEIANSTNESYIIWVNQNEEERAILKLIPDSVAVNGSEDPLVKENKLLGFARNEFRVLITKKKIAQFGLNYQHCHNQIFATIDFSFEGLYQAIRRSYRYGQKEDVNIHIISTETMENVITVIKQKEANFNELRQEMNKEINAKDYGLISDYTRRDVKTENYHLILGDSTEEMKTIPDNSIDFSIFSPPFSSLFTYTNNWRDLGNSENDGQFFEHYKFILKELFRILRPGRLIAVHTKDLAVYKNSDQYSGLYDFSGENLRACEEVGFKYHSRVTIWTDPVLEMQRTKTQRLLYKQVTDDATLSGVGIPEYLTIFRKWEGVTEENHVPVNNKTKGNFPLDTWQRWASPVWMDIMRTDVLSKYSARDVGDEKHICPLQLGVIERAIKMWTNPGEVVFTPFMGIGSEVYEAVRCGRKGIGIELKDSYFDQAVKNLKNQELLQNQMELF